jgi:hypothetical protein
MSKNREMQVDITKNEVSNSAFSRWNALMLRNFVSFANYGNAPHNCHIRLTDTGHAGGQEKPRAARTQLQTDTYVNTSLYK